MKKMIAAAAVAATAALAPAFAQAQDAAPTGVYANLGYAYTDASDIQLGALQAKLGYRFHPNFGVEAEGAFGIDDDKSAGAKVSLSHEFAAYGVGSNVLQVVTIPAMGLSMAVSTLVGQNIGAGNIERAARITVLGTIFGFIILSLVGLLAWFGAEQIVAFFIPDDAQVIAEGAGFIRIMCLAWGCIGIQLCIVSTFRASGNMLIAMVIALVSQWMVQFPMAYVLSKHTILQSHGLWWSFPVTNVVVAIVSICWFLRGSWKTTRLTEDEKQTAKVAQEAIIEDGIR